MVRAAATTATAARGASVPVLVLDEIGLIDGAGSTADGNAVYRSATPATSTFRQDRMIVLSSSPAEKTGPQYSSYLRALQIDPDTGQAANPHIFMLQAPSWDPYRDWQRAHTIAAWPGGPCFDRLDRSMIEPDDDEVIQMLETDPESHAVEYLGQFRSARNAYLLLDTVTKIFNPLSDGRVLEMETKGILGRAYMIHADPSVSGKNFAVAVAHTEHFDDGAHVVSDFLHVWRPVDFPDGQINYDYVENELYKLAVAFGAQRISFDQFNSAQIRQRLQIRLDDAGLPRRCLVVEQTATAALNWKMAELFKTAAAMGRVHAPDHTLARLELEYLQVDKTKVFAPTTGPVRTKDLFDAMANVVYALLEECEPELFKRLGGGGGLSGSQPGGIPPRSPDGTPESHRLLRARSRRQARRDMPLNPARGINPRRRPHPGIGF